MEEKQKLLPSDSALPPVPAPVPAGAVAPSDPPPGGKKLPASLLNKMDLVKKIYFLTLVGTLGPLGMEYYVKAEEFLNDGAMEGLLYFFGNLGAMVFIGQKAFEYGADKIKSVSHLGILLIVPMLFIQIEAETYLEESPAFVPFDKWFLFYSQGLKEFYGKRDVKKVRILFKKSIKDLEQIPEYEYLVMKTHIYLNLLESMVGKKEQALKNLEHIYNNYPKGDTHELALVVKGIGTLYNHFQKYDHAQPFLSRCLDIVKIKKLRDKDLIFHCQFEMAKYHLALGEREEAKVIVAKLFDFKGPKYLEVDKNLLWLTETFYELKETELCLDYYLTLLERYRASKNNQVIHQIYGRLSEIYNSKGNKAKAEIYHEFQKSLQEIGLEVVPQD